MKAVNTAFPRAVCAAIRRGMRTTVLLVALAGCLLGGAAPRPASPAFFGSGVQIYSCHTESVGPAWHLQGPEATLSQPGGGVVIHHFAGPSWQAPDGSVVVGEMVASAPGAPGSVPWLVLHAKAHRGAGVLASVTYIVRSQTEGGLPPASGCDKDHLGVEARVAYRAIYTFFN